MAITTTATQQMWEIAKIQDRVRKQLAREAYDMAMIGQQSVLGGVGTFAQPNINRNHFTPNNLARAIAMRMRWPEGNTPFDFMSCHHASEKQKVIVFLCVNKGDPVVLEDEEDLFPSDKLITQLRLIQNNK